MGTTIPLSTLQKDTEKYLFFTLISSSLQLLKTPLIPYPIRVCWHFNGRKEEEKGGYNNGIWMQENDVIIRGGRGASGHFRGRGRRGQEVMRKQGKRWEESP